MYEIFLALLKERGMKVADFCRATGVTQSSISSWKNRGGTVGSKLGQIIADYFEIPIDYLMTGKMPNSNYTPPRIDNPLILDLIATAEGCEDADIKQANDLLKRLKAYSEKLKELEDVRTETGK